MSSPFPPFKTFLPHAESIILLKKIEEAGESFVVCSACVGTPLLPGSQDTDPVSPLIGLEYIAQSIAAYGACSSYAKDSANEGKIGFIAGVKNLNVFADGFFLGQDLSIRAERSFLSETTAIFTGLIFDEKREKQLLSASITLVLTEPVLNKGPAEHV